MTLKPIATTPPGGSETASSRLLYDRVICAVAVFVLVTGAAGLS